MPGKKKFAGKTSLLAAVVIIAVLAALAYYMFTSRRAEVLPGESGKSAAAIPDSQTIENAVSSFLEGQRSPLAGKVRIAEPLIAGNYLRVSIIPKDSTSGDKAIGFLCKRGATWQVIAIGTSFEPEFYARNQIPEKLQL